MRLGSKNINRDIELSIERGNSVMIENMENTLEMITKWLKDSVLKVNENKTEL